VAPGNEEINVPTYRGTGSPLDRATLKGADDMAQAVECHFSGIKHEFTSSASKDKIFWEEKVAQ
jgi:hypothetical protein